MEILDHYILMQFLTNFLGAPSILVLIFVFHTIFTYIGELVGRGLGLRIIGRFLIYLIPQFIPIIMPLAVATSSIMASGAFAENYKLAAMKTSDISLMHVMLPPIVLMALLSTGTFFSADSVILVAYREVYMLRSNIVKVKPAMTISEGVFSSIDEDTSIKVAKKSGDNDRFLHNVLIHKETPDRMNRAVVSTKKGELKTAKASSNFLQFILEDGTYCEDIKTSSYGAQERLPFTKVHSQRYIISLDLSHLNNVDFNEKANATTCRMMNVGQLDHAIDSLRTDFEQNIADYGNNMFRRTGFYIAPSSVEEAKTTQSKTKAQEATSISQLLSAFPNDKKPMPLKMAMNNNQTQLDNAGYHQNDLEYRCKLMNLHILNLNDKFALTVACSVLFPVAAPLGAFICKGGTSLSLVVAVIVFLVYYFVRMFTRNIAGNNTINPALAPWILALTLLPFEVYLIARVTTDKEVFHSPFTNKIPRFAEDKIKQLKSKRTV